MIRVDEALRPPTCGRRSSACGRSRREKIRGLEKTWNPADGAPVFTVRGRYTARGWTEWTQGFQYGSALLQFDATGDAAFLELGRERTLARMAAARHAHRRARPRLQQRQHLRQPAAADARGPLRAGRPGSASSTSWR